MFMEIHIFTNTTEKLESKQEFQSSIKRYNEYFR